jgi:hypothetical protein
MKKKILALAIVLALVIALVVPIGVSAATGGSTVSGSVGTDIALTMPASTSVYQFSALLPENTNGEAVNNQTISNEIATFNLQPVDVTLTNTGVDYLGTARIASQLMDPSSWNPNFQFWAFDGANWWDINKAGWGPNGGFAVPSGYNLTTQVYVVSNASPATYGLFVNLVDAATPTTIVATTPEEYITVKASTANSISLTLPGSLTFGALKPGNFNYGDWGTTPASQLAVSLGTDGVMPSWTMTAKGETYMSTNGTGGTLVGPTNGDLTDPLLIGDGTNWWPADGTTTAFSVHGNGPYSGEYTNSGTATLNNFDLHAAQWVESNDVPGNYSDLITFTASISP